jgi:ABC-type protease/lipase transport system fused ATPase/permease subunit
VIFDLPWLPIYLGLCFLFHVWIGVAALVGALMLVALTAVAEMRARRPAREATAAASMRIYVADAARRNAESVKAMGMGPDVSVIWDRANAPYRSSQECASAASTGLGSISRVLRIALQSAVLGIGAYLVIRQEATAGVIIASSILTARALTPVDQAVGNWKSFTAARQSWNRLVTLLAAVPAKPEAMTLPEPREKLTVEAAAVAPPAVPRLTLPMSPSRSRQGRGSGSSARAPPASRPSPAFWSARGRPFGAPSGSTARRWRTGIGTSWADTSDTSRRRSSFSRAAWRRTSQDSAATQRPTR